MQRAELCLHELFEGQVCRSPRALAVVDERGELTYEELDRQGELLASHLRGVGIRPDELVGIYMGRCVEYVIACLAALKAGGAYLPLELAYPPSMLEEVVVDSGPRIVLTQERYAERLPRTQKRFCMDDGWEKEVEASESGGTARVDQENLAFVSYSSGTTGKPKGIANSHRAAVRS
jgi:non-ribosomal peptide synthetase component F